MNAESRRVWSMVVGLALVGAAACCHREQVSLKSPFERYDHNRTRRLSVLDASDPVTANPDESKPLARLHFFQTGDYPPLARQQFTIEFIQKDAPADSLPPAVLVPVFPGLPLPLSNAGVAGCAQCRTDRADLLDYLATGPLARAGIEAPEAAGDIQRATFEFAPILDVLARADFARLDEQQIRRALPQKGVEFAEVVHDTRYDPGAIGRTLAVRYRCFWFVLYKYPDQPGFTRLVVVNGVSTPDPADKAPDVSSC